MFCLFDFMRFVYKASIGTQALFQFTLKIFLIFLNLLLTNVLSSVNIYIVDAVVAELADALDLGSSVFDVGVQVLSTAPNNKNCKKAL